MARRIHIVPVEDESNGVWRVANMLAAEDGGTVQLGCGGLDDAEEVWVHGMWLPREWRACWRALRLGKRLVRMTHGSLSPVYLRYHGWKKWLVGPIERFFLRRADRIVATCEAEKGWIEAYLGKRCPPIEVTDIKRFFTLTQVGKQVRPVFPHGNVNPGSSPIPHLSVIASATPDLPSLHLLYLGRHHPLKGVDYLETAVAELNSSTPPLTTPPLLKIVSNAFGEEKEKVWEWCDVLVLPTLSENFGLVVAEALERGKRVITTDGAPAWGEDLELPVSSLEVRVSSLEEGLDGQSPSIRTGYGGRLLYLVGYRDGSRNERVRLLKEAIGKLVVSG